MLQDNSKISIIENQLSDQSSIKNNFMQSNEDLSISYSDQNIFCIWYHDDDLSENVRYEMRNRLKQSFNYARIFNHPLEFTEYLTGPLVVKKIFFIITSKDAESLCAVAAKRPQHQKVYQFQPNSSPTNDSLVFTDMNKLFVQISQDIRAYLGNNQFPSATKTSSTSCRTSVIPPPWSVWNSKKPEKSFRYWKKESPEFFLFQTLTRILTRMECDHKQSLTEMIAECRLYYINDAVEVKKIDDVKNNYKSTDAIWYYTRDSFLFRSVGRAFRSEDFEHIFKFRRYIIDLHQELNKLIKEQETPQERHQLYRGKKLSNTILQQLQDNIGALISMNGFLSTTRSRKTALEIFAGAGENRPNYESVLFEFCIDETTIAMTYAYISCNSQYPQEEEVLFTVGSVWQIDSVKKHNNSYWIVKLSSCNDVNLKMIDYVKELADDSAFLMLGDVLRKLGEHTKAEKFYYKMLHEPKIKDEIRATLYYNIAMINMDQGKDFPALKYLQEAEKLISAKVINTEQLAFQPLYSYSIVPSPIRILNNMGILYQKIDDSENAFKYFTKALNVERSDPIDRAIINDHIGLLYYSQGDYENAVKHLSEAVRLAQDDSSLTKFKQHYDAVNQHLLSRNNPLHKKIK